MVESAERRLGGRDGEVDDLLFSLAAVVGEHAHHRECNSTDLDDLPDGSGQRRRVREEELRHAASDHSDLAPPLDVAVVQEPTGRDRGALDVAVARVGAADVERSHAALVHDRCVVGWGEASGHVARLGQRLGEGHIAVRELDAASDGSAVMGARGLSSRDPDAVDGVIAEIPAHRALEAVAGCEQQDEHEDAPCH